MDTSYDWPIPKFFLLFFHNFRSYTINFSAKRRKNNENSIIYSELTTYPCFFDHN